MAMLNDAVNLSMSNVHKENLPDTVAALLAEHGVPADRLQVELTETALKREPAQATRVLQRLAALGVRIAIDDFGTGYSALSYLRRLRLTTIKLDRSFVTNMGRGGRRCDDRGRDDRVGAQPEPLLRDRGGGRCGHLATVGGAGV